MQSFLVSAENGHGCAHRCTLYGTLASDAGRSTTDYDVFAG